MLAGISKKEAALQLAAEHYYIFPLTPNSKVPIKGIKWREEATTDLNRVERWWDENPDYNIGIATGESSALSVIDIDAHHEGIETFNELLASINEPIPNTLSVRTPSGGIHYYLQYTPELRQTQNPAIGVDVRNDGGYVVGPGSSIDGNSYKWESTSPMIPVSTSLLGMFIKKTPAPKPPSSDTDSVLEGGRNQYLAKIAGGLRRQGLSSDEIYESLLTINDLKCNPPLDETEIRTISNSMGRYEPVPTPSSIALAEHFPQKPSKVIKASSLINESFEFLGNKKALKGTPTAIEGLNLLLGGGKRSGELTVWHAEAKSGKNTIWHYLMAHDLEKGIPVAYASRELNPATEVLPSIWSSVLRKNLLKCAVTEDIRQKATSYTEKWPLYFSDGYGYFSLSEIVEWVKELSELGVKQFWFDHMHYMLQDSENFQEASEFARTLKTLTKELNVHIDLIVQPTKIYEGMVMGKNTLRGGAGIGQALDNLIVIERQKDVRTNRKTNITKLSLVDKRFPLAREGMIYLEYDPETYQLIEVEEAVDREEIPDSTTSQGWNGANFRLS